MSCSFLTCLPQQPHKFIPSPKIAIWRKNNHKRERPSHFALYRLGINLLFCVFLFPFGSFKSYFCPSKLSPCQQNFQKYLTFDPEHIERIIYKILYIFFPLFLTVCREETCAFFVYCSRFAAVQRQIQHVSFTVSLDKQVPKKQTPTSGPSIPSPTPKENINHMKFFSHESLSPCHKCFAAFLFFLLCWL